MGIILFIAVGFGLSFFALTRLAKRIWPWMDFSNPKGGSDQSHHVIRSDYSSNEKGGITSTKTYVVPKDPQAYAKSFVPKDKRK